jgi:hypothetical protein
MADHVFWRCPKCKRILGEVIGSGDALAVFAEAVYGPDDPLPRVATVAFGKANVPCSVCQTVRVWNFKQEKVQ